MFALGIESSTENSEILLIGSGSGKGLGSVVINPYAFVIPSFTVANCTLPNFPRWGYQGYVGKMTPSGFLLCGGRSYKNYYSYDYHTSCSLLGKTGNWVILEEMDMKQKWRYLSAAVDTDAAWWITG